MKMPDRYEGRMDVREQGGRALEMLGDDEFKLAVLKAGWTVDRKRFYTRECIQDAVARDVFGGQKMFMDHAGPADQARGTRSVGDWWATTAPGTWYDEASESVMARATAHSDQALSILRNDVARMAAEFSHDSYVEYHRDEIESRKCMAVDRIAQCNSVDFVPFGNAGGRLTESLDEEDAEMTADEIKEAVAAGVREGLGEDMLAKLDGMAMGIMAMKDLIAGWTGYVSPEYREEEAASESADTTAENTGEPEEESEAPAQEAEPKPETETGPEHDAPALEAAVEAHAFADAITEAVDATDGLTVTERKRLRVLANAVQCDVADIPARIAECAETVREESRAIMREHGITTKITGAGPSAPVRHTEAKSARELADQRLRARGVSENIIGAID